MLNPQVYFSSTEDLEKILSAPFPKPKLPPKPVFDPSSFLQQDSEPSEICQFFLSGSCKFLNKCKNYHPPILPEAECTLCKVKIKSSLRKFGILSSCNDVFCFPCIRQWRSRGNVCQEITNSCPVCGKISGLLISSPIYPQIFEDKLDLIHHLTSKSK